MKIAASGIRKLLETIGFRSPMPIFNSTKSAPHIIAIKNAMKMPRQYIRPDNGALSPNEAGRIVTSTPPAMITSVPATTGTVTCSPSKTTA